MNSDWIVPDWPAPPRVRSMITTRAGGVSTGPYSSLNLGLATGDREENVRANRERLRAVLPQEPRWLRQVHGSYIVDADNLVERVEADASYARTPSTVCAIQIADCMPVFLTNRTGSMIAAAHAGWRGLASGVLENAVAAFGGFGIAADDLIAYLGP